METADCVLIVIILLLYGLLIWFATRVQGGDRGGVQ